MADNNLEKYTNTNPVQQFFLKRFSLAVDGLFDRVPNPLAVLDVGCGEGFTMQRLKRKHPESTFTGIDPDIDALAFAKAHDTQNTYTEGSIFSIPYADNSFDVILCNEVFEHLKEPEKGLQEIHRVSKKFLIASVPHEPFFRLSNFLRGRNIARLGNYPYHLQTWTKQGFVEFISRHFHVREVRCPFPWTVIRAEKK